MNAKTAQQIENLKNQTIGVEVEMNHITRKAAAQLAADYFGTGRSEYTASRNGYMTWSAWDAQGREWKFQRDVSIAGPDDEKCELVTPILKYEDIETLQELVRLMRKSGGRSSAEFSCGVHVHIGGNGHTPQTLRNLANVMASHEDLLVDALQLDRNRINRYCRMVDPDFLKALNHRKPKTMSELADVWYSTQSYGENRNAHYNASRYKMYNLHSLFTNGNIEFRLYEFPRRTAEKKNELHGGYLKTFIQLSLALSEFAKEIKTASPKIHQRENKKFAMRTFLIRLGMVGAEFETARMLLTKNLEGDAAFRFGRP